MCCTDPPGKLSSECESSSDCNIGDLIWIKSCSATATDQRFTAVGQTIRPAIDQNLCFTIMGYGTAQDTDGSTITTPIQLQLCEENNSLWDFKVVESSSSNQLAIRIVVWLSSITPNHMRRYIQDYAPVHGGTPLRIGLLFDRFKEFGLCFVNKLTA